MTSDAVSPRKHDNEPGRQLSPEQAAAAAMVAEAKARGLELTGPNGLLKLFTKNVLETALNEELTEHLGHEKNQADQVLPINRANPTRTPGPRLPTQPRHQRPTPGRSHRHHRSHPKGGPQHDQAIHHPRPHRMMLKRPWRRTSALSFGAETYRSELSPEEALSVAPPAAPEMRNRPIT